MDLRKTGMLMYVLGAFWLTLGTIAVVLKKMPPMAEFAVIGGFIVFLIAGDWSMKVAKTREQGSSKAT